MNFISFKREFIKKIKKVAKSKKMKYKKQRIIGKSKKVREYF